MVWYGVRTLWCRLATERQPRETAHQCLLQTSHFPSAAQCNTPQTHCIILQHTANILHRTATKRHPPPVSFAREIQLATLSATHSATRCPTLQQKDTPQVSLAAEMQFAMHSATHSATRWRACTLQQRDTRLESTATERHPPRVYCKRAVFPSATHCNTLQTYCNILQQKDTPHQCLLQERCNVNYSATHSATRCPTLQQAAPHCNLMQYIATESYPASVFSKVTNEKKRKEKKRKEKKRKEKTFCRWRVLHFVRLFLQDGFLAKDKKRCFVVGLFSLERFLAKERQAVVLWGSFAKKKAHTNSRDA